MISPTPPSNRSLPIGSRALLSPKNQLDGSMCLLRPGANESPRLPQHSVRRVLIVCAYDVSFVEAAGLETPPRQGIASARLESRQELQLRRHPCSAAAASGGKAFMPWGSPHHISASASARMRA